MSTNHALKRGKKTWRTRDGRILEIEKMTDGHIINTYNLLRRCNCVPLRDLQPFLRPAYPPIGEHAQDAFEAACDEMFDKIPSIHMEWFEDEMKRRGLDPDNPGLLHKLRNKLYGVRKAVGLG